MRWLLTTVAAAILATACGGSGGNAGSPCERLTQTLCQRSCDCRPVKDDRAQCSITVGTASGGNSTHSRNPLPCVASLTRDVCGDTTKTAALFDACLAALDQAMCASSGPTESALKLPAACNGVLDCQSGPCTQ